jgi:hypothetical protein
VIANEAGQEFVGEQRGLGFCFGFKVHRLSPKNEACRWRQKSGAAIAAGES